MKLKLVLSALAVLLIPVLALAQELPLPTPDDFTVFLNMFLSATLNVKVALGLAAAVWAIRKYVVGKVEFFQTAEGGAVLLSGIAFLTSLAGSFYRLEQAMTWPWFGNVCATAFAVAALTGGTWGLVQSYVRLLAPRLIQSTKLAKVPFIGTIVIKVSEIALKAVKSKLEKVAEGQKVFKEPLGSEPLAPAAVEEASTHVIVKPASDKFNGT